MTIDAAALCIARMVQDWTAPDQRRVLYRDLDAAVAAWIVAEDSAMARHDLRRAASLRKPPRLTRSERAMLKMHGIPAPEIS